MAVAPLSLVQAVIAGGLVLIAYPATRYFGHKLNRASGSASASPPPGSRSSPSPSRTRSESEGYSIATLAGFEAVMVGAGCALFASGVLRRGSICHGVVLGLASGLLIGVSNVAIKALTEGIGVAGLDCAAQPLDRARRVGGLGAFFALARGMQLGEAIPVIATASVASNCAAILGGVIVFGDPIGSGAGRGPRPRPRLRRRDRRRGADARAAQRDAPAAPRAGR